MIKKLLLFVLMTSLFNSPVWSWDKSKFDIDIQNQSLTLKKTGGIGYEGQQIKKTVSEMTLIQGGYFTIGTNQGLSPTALDDHCGVTFGHPYALTSYPVISIDGNWGKLDDFFDIFASVPSAAGDSLILTCAIYYLQYRFCIKSDNLGEKIFITSTITNFDSRSHVCGTGLVFDAGLGKKGDGWIISGNQLITRDTLLTGASLPTKLMIAERNSNIAGMKVSIDLNADMPGKIILANWNDVYQNPGPDFLYSELRKLYDLVVKLIWDEQIIRSGESISKTAVLTLHQPDFGEQLFMRWDVPGFLSIENNLLFPRSFDSFIDVANLTQFYDYNATLNFIFPDELSTGTTSLSVNIPANQTVYQKVTMQSKESYEDKIVDLTIQLEGNGLLLDSIKRQIFIPAIPVSDTGLVCTIDTVMTSKYPDIGLIFEAQVEATGQKIGALQNENIFLSENGARIKQFTLGKDTTGGVTMADIVFVLDCSGSMGDDIQKVRNNINEFSDSLIARGVDFRLGVVTFSTTIDKVYDFTSDVELFKSWLASIQLWGGVENSLGALYRATELSFRAQSKRTFVWITDEEYPVYPAINLTVQDVVNRLLFCDVTVHSISLTSLQTKWSNPIIEPTGGNFYDIYGNFRDILLDISRMKGSSRYLLTYKSPGAIQGINEIALEIHYAGLGGTGNAEYNFGSAGNQLHKAIDCFPNPFNPIIQIALNLPDFSEATLDIYNILGQRVRSFPLQATSQRHVILWDAKDNWDREVSMGTYFVRLNVFGKDGKLQRNEITKILYLK